MEGGFSFKHFANWFVILTMNESVRLSSKVIPAICPRMLALNPLRTRGFSRIFMSSLMVLLARSKTDRYFFDGVVTLCPSWDFIDQTRIFLDRHVLCKTGSIVNMRALRDIVAILQVLQSSSLDFETLLETTEGQALVRLIKSIGPYQESTRGKRPAVLVIPPVKNGGLGGCIRSF